jgi:hypothetical protein
MFCSFLSKGINSLSKSCENNINYNRKKFGNIIQFTFLYSTSKIFILTWCFRWSFRTVSKSRSWIFPDKMFSFSFIQETNSSQELLNNWALKIRNYCKGHHYRCSVSTGLYSSHMWHYNQTIDKNILQRIKRRLQSWRPNTPTTVIPHFSPR